MLKIRLRIPLKVLELRKKNINKVVMKAQENRTTCFSPDSHTALRNTNNNYHAIVNIVNLIGKR